MSRPGACSATVRGVSMRACEALGDLPGDHPGCGFTGMGVAAEAVLVWLKRRKSWRLGADTKSRLGPSPPSSVRLPATGSRASRTSRSRSGVPVANQARHRNGGRETPAPCGPRWGRRSTNPGFSFWPDEKRGSRQRQPTISPMDHPTQTVAMACGPDQYSWPCCLPHRSIAARDLP